MNLRPDRRVVELTAISRDLGLVVRRLVAGSVFLGVATGLWVLLPGFWKLFSFIVAIPGAYTLFAIRRPYTAPCPGCGHTLGGELIVLPDEPVVGPGALNLRCPSCGIYLDAPGSQLREAPFNRTLDGPGFELSLPSEHLATLDWPAKCVCCGRDATRSLSLSKHPVGVLSGAEARMTDGLKPGNVPYCADHGDRPDPIDRSVIVALAGGRVTVQLSQYAAYRRLLDTNRTKVEVTLREIVSG